MNLTAFLSVDTSKWQDGWKQAENQSDTAFRKITSEMTKMDSVVKKLENSMKSGREKLAERLTAMGATAEQQAQVLAKYDYTQKLKEQIAQTKALQAAEQSRIGTLKNLVAAAKNIAIGAIAIGGVRGLVEMADKYNEINATIKNATASGDEFNYFQQAAQEIAQKTYKSYEQIAGQITALVPTMKTLGFSSNTIKEFAETMNLGFRANGFKGGEQVIQALSKSFNKGVIDARAFQAALLAIPDLADNIAKALGKTEAEVKALGVAGKLTTAEFVKGVQASKGVYDKQAANVVLSVSDAFQSLKNNIQKFIGETNNASGVTKTLANGIKMIGENIDLIAKGLMLFAGVKAASLFMTLAGAVATTTANIAKSTMAWAAETAAITADTRAKMANAIAAGAVVKANQLGSGMNAIANSTGLLVGGFSGIKNAISGILKFMGKGGILAAIAAVIALTGQWQNTLDSIKYIWESLSGIGKQVFSDISAGIQSAWQSIKGFLGESELLSGFFAQFDSGIFGVFEMVGKAADTIVAALRGVIEIVVQTIGNTVKVTIKTIAKTIEIMLKGVENQINKVIEAADWVNRKFGGDGIDFRFDLTPKALEDLANQQIDLGLDIKQIFGDSFKMQRENGLQAYFETMAAEIKQRREFEKQEQAARQAAIDNLDKNADNLSQTAESIAKANENIKKSAGAEKTDTQKYIDMLKIIEPEKQKYWADPAKYYETVMKELDLTAKIDFSKIDWAAVDKFKLTGEETQTTGIDANTVAMQENTAALLENTKLKQASENMGKPQNAVEQSGGGLAKMGEMTLQIVTDTEKLRVKIVDNPSTIERFKQIAQQATSDFINSAALANA